MANELKTRIDTDPDTGIDTQRQRQRPETETETETQTETKTEKEILRPSFRKAENEGDFVEGGLALEMEKAAPEGDLLASVMTDGTVHGMGGLAPILMRRDEAINLKMAIRITGRSEKTIRGWCKEFAIGVQPCPGAPLEISAPALEMVRHGDVVALDLLREGKRDHPRVLRFFEHLGIPP